MASPSDAPPGAFVSALARHLAGASATRGRAGLTLAIALFVAAACVFYGAGIRIDTDLKKLLPPTAPSVAALDELGQRRGSTEKLIVAVGSDDLEGRQKIVDGLAEMVGTWPETLRLEVGRDHTPLRDHALYMLELDQLVTLRDKLRRERRAAVARSMSEGVGLGGPVDPDAVTVGDDWDDFGEEDFGDGDGDGDGGPSPTPEGEGQGEEDDFDLRTWLDEQKASVVEAGPLNEREVDTLWPKENEAGELIWLDEVIEPFINTQGTTQLLKAELSKPATDVRFAQTINEQIAAEGERLAAEFGVSDAVVKVVAAYNVSEDIDMILVDVKRATWVSGFLVLLVLVVGFRSPRALLLVVGPMAVATCITLALARITVGELNALTAFLFAVLFGMGVDFSVHLFAQRQNRGPDAQWESVLRGHLRPLISTMLTTSGSLFVLELAQFRAFREFGLVAGIGVFVCLVCAIVLVPAIDVLLGPMRGKAEPGPAVEDATERPPPRAGRFLRVGALLGLVGFAITFAPNLAFEKDTRELSPPKQPKKPGARKLNYGSATGRCSKPVALLADDAATLDRAVARIEAARDAEELLPGGITPDEGVRRPWVVDIYSVSSLMPEGQDDKAAVLKEIAEQTNGFLAELPDLDEEARQYQSHLEALERLSLAKPLRPEELPAWALEPFSEGDGRFDRMALMCARLQGHHLDELVAFDKRLRELAGPEVRYADSRIVFADLIGDVQADAQRLPPWALLVVVLMIAADLRRPVPTLACAATLTLGLGSAVAFMGAWPLHLNFFNLVVMPAVAGLGIDASIHLWHARKRASLPATAKATLLAALTTTAGFSGLLVAEHPGMRSIGEVGVASVVICVGIAFLALHPLRFKKR